MLRMLIFTQEVPGTDTSAWHLRPALPGDYWIRRT